VANFRIGQGFDIHRLVEGRPLLLAGVSIPAARGLLGHSDGDAVLHAVCDALLGAASAGDIGSHFPDTEPRYAGAASSTFVAEALQVTRARGLVLANVDVTILAEEPRLAPYIPAMRASLARLLDAREEQVSIKAKTTEGLGDIGRGEAIAATAVVLLARIEV
jgi:2-C-methyl-D-erythritol 2,4-cyclodiphosphate synthase